MPRKTNYSTSHINLSLRFKAFKVWPVTASAINMTLSCHSAAPDFSQNDEGVVQILIIKLASLECQTGFGVLNAQGGT